MGLPSIGGYIIPGKKFYKYVPIEENKTIYMKKTITEKRKIPNIDQSILVQLGGPFEQIGGNDEATGGGNQKVGTNN